MSVSTTRTRALRLSLRRWVATGVFVGRALAMSEAALRHNAVRSRDYIGDDAFAIEQAAVPLSQDEVARLYQDNARAVLAFLARRVLLPEVAVDLMAETFARAYRDRNSFRGEGEEQAVAWVYGIARHVLGSYERRGAVERQALHALAVERRALTGTEYERVEELAGLDALRARIDRELDALEAGQRHALRLRVLEERPYREVARELGVSEQTARARVSRALRALRDSSTFKELRGQPDHA